MPPTPEFYRSDTVTIDRRTVQRLSDEIAELRAEIHVLVESAKKWNTLLDRVTRVETIHETCPAKRLAEHIDQRAGWTYPQFLSALAAMVAAGCALYTILAH